MICAYRLSVNRGLPLFPLVLFVTPVLRGRPPTPASVPPSGADSRASVLLHLWESTVLPWLTPRRGSSHLRGSGRPATQSLWTTSCFSKWRGARSGGAAASSSCLIACQVHLSTSITNLTPSSPAVFLGSGLPAGDDGDGGFVCWV